MPIDCLLEHMLGVDAVLVARMGPRSDVVAGRIVEHLIDGRSLPVSESILERVQLVDGA